MATMMTPSLQRTPTDVTYISLDEAFAHFNDELFDGELPAILITLQRRKDVRGYFSAAKVRPSRIGWKSDRRDRP
jgi:hypothetical protein